MYLIDVSARKRRRSMALYKPCWSYLHESSSRCTLAPCSPSYLSASLMQTRFLPYKVNSVNYDWVIVDPCNNGWHVGQVPERRGENAVNACNSGWTTGGLVARTGEVPLPTRLLAVEDCSRMDVPSLSNPARTYDENKKYILSLGKYEYYTSPSNLLHLKRLDYNRTAKCLRRKVEDTESVPEKESPVCAHHKRNPDVAPVGPARTPLEYRLLVANRLRISRSSQPNLNSGERCRSNFAALGGSSPIGINH
ncbi:xylosidase glycosyl [Moniliophthora roreri]|nr:xylosidase glycosyl [Moniliophthora roreri]